MIHAITSEPFDPSAPNQSLFVQGGNVFNSKYIIIVIKMKIATSRHPDFARISL
jgi:hypothetical protein